MEVRRVEKNGQKWGLLFGLSAMPQVIDLVDDNEEPVAAAPQAKRRRLSEAERLVLAEGGDPAATEAEKRSSDRIESP